MWADAIIAMGGCGSAPTWWKAYPREGEAAPAIQAEPEPVLSGERRIGLMEG
jgi:hypothetical protein